jgi:hypothetical protein
VQNSQGWAAYQEGEANCFSSLFQLLERPAGSGHAPPPNHHREALEFVIEGVIRKYTPAQADSTADSTAEK